MQEAIQSGREESVDALLRSMTKTQQKTQLCATYELKAMMKAKDSTGRTVLAAAASSGKRGAFDTVLAGVENELDPIEIGIMMRAKDSRKRSLLAFAVDDADEDTFRAVQEFLERELSEEELYDLIAPEEYLGNKLLLQAMKLDKGKDLGLMKAVLNAVRRCFDRHNPYGEWLERSRNLCGQEVLCQAIRCCEIDLFQGTPDFVKDHLADRKAAEEISTIFSLWADKRVWVGEIASAVKDHTATKIEEFFQNLFHGNKLLDWVKTCLSGPLVSSKNPFVPGMKLSVAFSRAAGNAPEGERRNLLYLQQTVDKFLLEVLERLPQTVRGCKGRMDCSALFEPESLDKDRSPLQMMVGKRKQRIIFCKVPLVMDYLSVRFSRGLLDLLETDGIRGEREVLGNLAETNHGFGRSVSGDLEPPFTSTIASDEPPSVILGIHQMLPLLRNLWALLQGTDSDFPSLVGIPIVGRCPGLLSIIAGIVARPGQYYRVPMLRMVLDFIVYVAMLAVFSVFVLFHPDGEPTWREIIFFVSFVAAGILREVREMVRDFEAYLDDHWNILDVLSLALLLGGFILRNTDSANPFGRALYALSAPLVFSRVLFFAQILPFQGPMIQSIVSMTGELIKFGVVILVVMLGFVMSFLALFLNVETFGQIWLDLFKAMLGEVGLFDDFQEQSRDQVARALLIVYLVIMNIMLLNLLIAVLSTAHSKVEENAEREFKVSKARVIQHYEMIVQKELLPVPFNVVQLALSWLFSGLHACCQRVLTYSTPDGGGSLDPEQISRIDTVTLQVLGQGVFWVVLGPVAVLAGVILWILSVFYAPYAWTKRYFAQSGPISNFPFYGRVTLLALQWLVIIVWCGLVAPLGLVVMWLGAPFWSRCKWLKAGCCRRQKNRQPNDGQVSPGLRPDVREPDSFDVNEMLLNAPGGVDARSLFAYLMDPMNDPEVRQDEIKRHTTVEHIKFLRNRLENTAKQQSDELRTVIKSTTNELREETRQMKEKLVQKLEEAMQDIEQEIHIWQNLEQKLDKVMYTLGKIDLILRRENWSTDAGGTY